MNRADRVGSEVVRPVTVPATPFKQADVRVLGLRLRYVDVGPNDGRGAIETVVLIPGITSRIEDYDDLVRALSARRRVLVLDLPGSGYSDKPERTYDLTFYEDTLVSFLDEMGVARAHLGGGSLGGNLVLRLAHRFPDRFDRLVAWAPGSAWKAHPYLARLLRLATSRALFWLFVRVQSRYWYRHDLPGRAEIQRANLAYYREVMCSGFVKMYFGIAADQVARTLFDIAPHIRHPTLLAWGDRDDGANMQKHIFRLHRLLPSDELAVFRGARHALATEVPVTLAAVIEEFLSRPAADLPRVNGEKQTRIY